MSYRIFIECLIKYLQNTVFITYPIYTSQNTSGIPYRIPYRIPLIYDNPAYLVYTLQSSIQSTLQNAFETNQQNIPQNTLQNTIQIKVHIKKIRKSPRSENSSIKLYLTEQEISNKSNQKCRRIAYRIPYRMHPLLTKKKSYRTP